MFSEKTKFDQNNSSSRSAEENEKSGAPIASCALWHRTRPHLALCEILRALGATLGREESGRARGGVPGFRVSRLDGAPVLFALSARHAVAFAAVRRVLVARHAIVMVRGRGMRGQEKRSGVCLRLSWHCLSLLMHASQLRRRLHRIALHLQECNTLCRGRVPRTLSRMRA